MAFDSCFYLDVLGQIPNEAASLGEMKRVSNKDAILIIPVPVKVKY